MVYRKLIIKPLATIEIEEVILSYLSINLDLAKKLEKEIRNAYQLISKNPESFQRRYDVIRVFWLDKFPYGIFYILEENSIFILAFWHSKEDIANKVKRL